jgi:hypothetical protein
MTEQTAMFYNEPTAEALEQAMLRFEEQPELFQTNTLRARAAFFSEAEFVARLTTILEQAMNRSESRIPPCRPSSSGW